MDDVVRTDKMSGVTAGENALPVIDGVGEGEGILGDATGSRTGPRCDTAGAGAVS